jgi:hypothetical protein
LHKSENCRIDAHFGVSCLLRGHAREAAVIQPAEARPDCCLRYRAGDRKNESCGEIRSPLVPYATCISGLQLRRIRQAGSLTERAKSALSAPAENLLGQFGARDK